MTKELYNDRNNITRGMTIKAPEYNILMVYKYDY